MLPATLHIMPISTRPYFPGQAQPVTVNMEQWGDTLREVARSGHRLLGVAFIEGKESGQAAVADFPVTGCVVRLHRVPNPQDSSEESAQGVQNQFLVQGIKRFRVVRWLSEEAPFLAQVEYPRSEGQRDSDEVKAYAMALIKEIKELLPLNPLYSEELKHYLSHFSPNEPSFLADFCAALTTASGAQLQQVLETLPLIPRMELVLNLLRKEREVAELQTKITGQVNQQVSAQQREFFLREQLKVIQKELGISKDDKTVDADDFQARLEGLVVPAEAQKRIDEELRKLSFLETGSPEYAVTRNYLDWATSVPWGKYSQDVLDLGHAREQLNSHHDGLEDVKERIIEFLAVGTFKGEVSGSILLLVGPPGVGKTSIGRSVADALGREFYRFSLGGMRDEAEIKGHRRTYIGAMPGKLVQALKDVEVSNPVIMLDEIDKIGSSYQGDPASALLEVLDPEQNSEFLDHYLDLRVDLSKVLFVCTANQLDSIPAPLLDRMETIRLSGYIAEEKLVIARNHLWPRLLQRSGVRPDQLKINDAGLRYVIDAYCREAGVRSLEKQLARIVRKSIVRLLEGDQSKLRVGRKDIEDLLGKPPFANDKPLRGLGIATGLAWTSLGGVTLAIESSQVHTLNRGFKLTGKLGEVMRESADIAYSYVMSHLKDYGCPPDYFDTSLVHLHVPEGATPKDGPSAGITMATALLSLARKERIARPLAMTGELTLTGQVLGVGGIREKVIAARRSRIMELILPAANKKDFEELPDYLREGINVHFARTFRDVFHYVFENHLDDNALH
ncbi:endopeptidase La [Halieaceae bacterium IMCC14734]|uniref:Lon protease n=2 Tax=Candidatus Litorirhabdus singularis TaxID=2518993 RepID=A0ABT3TJ30_9GAMM|nr:endopeptidase La [Candidatus Litorirhabdus singularis]